MLRVMRAIEAAEPPGLPGSSPEFPLFLYPSEEARFGANLRARGLHTKLIEMLP